MTFQQNPGNGSDHIGSGQESALNDVLDNLGLDEAQLNQDAEDALGNEGDDSFESNTGRDFVSEDELTRFNQQDQQRRQPQHQQQFRQPDPRQQQRPIPQNAEVRADQRGNLVGPDGRVVARAGFEARMYQETQRARRDLASSQAQVQDVSSRLARAIEIGQQMHNRVEQLQASLNDRNGAAARLGLNDAESIQAMQLAASAKTDPIGTVKKILTMAAAAGVDLSKIGIAPGGVDTKSLVDMVRAEITNAMNPLQTRLQQERQSAEQQEHANRVYRETESEVTQFFGQNPEAREYIPVFHAVLSEPRFQHMSMGEVWARIQLNQMRMNGNGQLRQNPQPRRNLPSGRGNPSYTPQSNEMAPVSQSYDSILRETLDALGV